MPRKRRVVVPPFHRLPAELIILIFDMAWADVYEGLCGLWASLPRRYHSHTFKSIVGTTPLAPIHISSYIRAVLLSHLPLWRMTAGLVQMTALNKNINKLLHLLSFVADLSEHTLPTANFRTLSDNHKACFTAMMALLGTVVPSAAYLQEIRLWFLPSTTVEECTCRSCRKVFKTENAASWPAVPPDEALEQTNTALLNLLCEANAVEYLDLHFYGLPHVKQDLNMVVNARPRTIRLTIDVQEYWPGDLLKIFGDLASNAEELAVYVKHQVSTSRNRPHRLTQTVVGSASRTVKKLELGSDYTELNPYTLLSQYSFKSLQSLLLCSSDIRRSADAPVTAAIKLPLLELVEGPACFVGMLHAPRLRSITIRLGDSVEQADVTVFLRNLEQCTEVEDLVLHSQMLSQEEASELLQAILLALAPRTAVGYGDCLCPNLRRLSIINGSPSRPKGSISTTAFIDPKFLQDTIRHDEWRRDGDDRGNAPMIGLALYNLVKGRHDVFKSSSLDVSGDGKQPLEVVRVLNCLVMPETWSLLLDVPSCEAMSCHPDPEVWSRDMTQAEDTLLDGLDEDLQVV